MGLGICMVTVSDVDVASDGASLLRVILALADERGFSIRRNVDSGWSTDRLLVIPSRMRVREYNQHRAALGRGFNKISSRAIAANACLVRAIAMIHERLEHVAPAVRGGRRRLSRLVNNLASSGDKVQQALDEWFHRSCRRRRSAYGSPAIGFVRPGRGPKLPISITTRLIPAMFGAVPEPKPSPNPARGRIEGPASEVKASRAGASTRRRNSPGSALNSAAEKAFGGSREVT